ncbi:MAG: M28 family peptidase [Bacteroidota bacterium]|nr:M28 family peptidase [Bacteroidota bacterium]
MLRHFLFLIPALLLHTSAYSQDSTYVRKTLSLLCSPEYAGRGYVKKGVERTATFLSTEMQRLGIRPLVKNYEQKYYLPVNTFPYQTEVKIDNQTLIPGKDYLIGPASPSCKGNFMICRIDSGKVKNKKDLAGYFNKDLKKSFVVIDTSGIRNNPLKELLGQIVEWNLLNAKGVITVSSKELSWSQSPVLNNFTSILVKKEILPDSAKTAEINIKSKYLKHCKASNIAGYIEGQTDSCLVFTAHYDHLGMMGDVYFPGANDNAFSVAMILDLAKHYQNAAKPKYSLVFLLFSGEEDGLLGSDYFSKHPLFPLEKIKFLINLDVDATGEDGITVVNATVHKEQYKRLTEINNRNQYMKNVASRGPARNSDHYPFYAKNVPCFFIYARGKEAHYHNPGDTPENLTLNQYRHFFHLITDFTDSF